jgi:hypothetical protein
VNTPPIKASHVNALQGTDSLEQSISSFSQVDVPEIDEDEDEEEEDEEEETDFSIAETDDNDEEEEEESHDLSASSDVDIYNREVNKARSQVASRGSSNQRKEEEEESGEDEGSFEASSSFEASQSLENKAQPQGKGHSYSHFDPKDLVGSPLSSPESKTLSKKTFIPLPAQTPATAVTPLPLVSTPAPGIGLSPQPVLSGSLLGGRRSGIPTSGMNNAFNLGPTNQGGGGGVESKEIDDQGDDEDFDTSSWDENDDTPPTP